MVINADQVFSTDVRQEPAMSLLTTPLKPRIGTKIEASKADLLSGQHSELIRELLERRGVLLFPELHLSDEEQRTFAATLGKVIPQGDKGIYKITLDQKLNPTADYLHATYF